MRASLASPRRAARPRVRASRSLPGVERLEGRVTLSGLAGYSPVLLEVFQGENGSTPQTNLVADAQGNFYGTTIYGGKHDGGTLFEVEAGTGRVVTLYSFRKGLTGSNPVGSLVIDAKGNVYGTTVRGGGGEGEVFEYVAARHTVSHLDTFILGRFATGGLTRDPEGNIYGTTQKGGSLVEAEVGQVGRSEFLVDKGTIFEIPAGTNNIRTLAEFHGANGARPFAAPTVDAAGNLFGSTYFGGAHGQGVVYEVPAGTNRVVVLASLDKAVGTHPMGGLAIDAAGDLYGTTTGGGVGGAGTIFKIKPASPTVQVLAQFTDQTGRRPIGNLLIDGSGNLFGTTHEGGAHNEGAVFALPAGGHEIDNLLAFSFVNGANPSGGLAVDAQGDLFGTTSRGGPGVSKHGGTVFELIPR